MSQVEGSMLHVEGQQDDSEGSTSPHAEDQQDRGNIQPQQSQAVATHVQGLQRQKITQLEEKLEALESRQKNWYAAKGRVIRCVVALFDSIEDLITENDRRYNDDDQDTSVDQDRLQISYATLAKTLPWFHKRGSEIEYDEYSHMLEMLRQGADGACGDDTSKLKTLVSEWVNRKFKPLPPVDHDDKHLHGFAHDLTRVRTGIQHRSDSYVITDLSFPAFLYDKYTTNPNDLEEGLFKGKLLIQSYKAVFTSPSSAKDIEGDGNSADVISNNQQVKKSLSGIKAKKHIAQIIHMDKVTPCSITYIACQVRFTLSSVTSWQSMDGDFDYLQFWQSIMDFFERAPGQEVHCRVERLLEWWTRKVFGRNRQGELSNAAKANLSINALARQREQHDNAAFDSPQRIQLLLVDPPACVW
ncbi:uncharacterized protein BJ212DRAFT_1294763 [Suillus subaureus]|uniref:Uncharacterized protein n=1 Tax=Suillus subaureus TaxID=48587 RepID=A0A9P7EPB6_9AGAM|nr:uncharacterized protein BJ212DRAFT_1294763 [Suillus subaureus]KAG1827512.1 hypothetical protein BJ212DRAFT_1294763 [Suillus subaureus]